MKPYKPSELAVQMMDYLAEEDGIDWQQEIMGVRGQELWPDAVDGYSLKINL